MTLHAKPAENTRLVISARTRSSPSWASSLGSGLGGSRRFSALAPPLRFSARARMVLNEITVHGPFGILPIKPPLRGEPTRSPPAELVNIPIFVDFQSGKRNPGLTGPDRSSRRHPPQDSRAFSPGLPDTR